MEKHAIKEVVNFIASFLVDTTGNEIFNGWREKRKIDKILENDKRNIKRIFYTIDNSDLFNLIEEFIIFSAFKDTTFYSSVNLTESQEDKLWEAFSMYIKRETNDYVNSNYRDKIIRCVNLHNAEITRVLFDTKNKFIMNKMQKQHETIDKKLGKIISTLNTETRLQEKDDELAFVTEQMESIMISYKYDINQLRKMQTFGLCGIMIVTLLLSIIMSKSLEYIQNIYVVILMLFFLLLIAMLEWMLFDFWIHVSKKVRILEDKVEEMRLALWKIHFELFNDYLKRKYTHKDI